MTAIANAAGSVLERYVYDPYGAPTRLTAIWGTPSSDPYNWVYLHQGGRYEAATGLYNFRMREYSSTLGRWLQNDPIRYAASDLNLFRYANNSPQTQVDPSGLDWTDWIPDWMWGPPPSYYNPMYIPKPHPAQKPRPETIPFSEACKDACVDQKTCECIVNAYDIANKLTPKIAATNTCTKWAQNFANQLNKCQFGDSGVRRSVLYFEFDAFAGATDGHCTVAIRLPNGKIYIFDNGAMGGVSTPKDIPPGWKYDPRFLDPKYMDK